jgi:hypothetical protein
MKQLPNDYTAREAALRTPQRRPCGQSGSGETVMKGGEMHYCDKDMDWEHARDRTHFIPAQPGYRVWERSKGHPAFQYVGEVLVWMIREYEMEAYAITWRGPSTPHDALVSDDGGLCSNDGGANRKWGPCTFVDFLEQEGAQIAFWNADLARRLYNVPDDLIEQAPVTEQTSNPNAHCA